MRGSRTCKLFHRISHIKYTTVSAPSHEELLVSLSEHPNDLFRGKLIEAVCKLIRHFCYPKPGLTAGHFRRLAVRCALLKKKDLDNGKEKDEYSSQKDAIL